MAAHPPFSPALRRPPVGGADRLVVVLSDIEMGPGGPFDDFPHSDFLAEVLLSYGREPFDDLEVDLVFNGDTLDLLKTPWAGTHPHHITAGVAVGKLGLIIGAHPAFFDALGEFLRPGPERRRAWFVVGNHDIDLLFPEVCEAIEARIGAAPGCVRFPGVDLQIGDLHVEHGSQQDVMFAIDPAVPFIEVGGERILNLPWGTIGLLEMALRLQPVLYHHDRLRPREHLFELMPEVQELLRSVAFRYWTRDYWANWLRQGDPVKKVSWTLFKDIALRLGTADFNLSISAQYRARLRDGEHRVIVVGHEHSPGLWTWGDRRLLRTGCLRNEFVLEEQGAVQRPLPKSWAEVYLRGGHPVRSHLVDADGPAPPAGWMPESIFDALPRVRELLAHGMAPEISAAVDEQESREQESRELKERDPEGG